MAHAPETKEAGGDNRALVVLLSVIFLNMAGFGLVMAARSYNPVHGGHG